MARIAHAAVNGDDLKQDEDRWIGRKEDGQRARTVAQYVAVRDAAAAAAGAPRPVAKTRVAHTFSASGRKRKRKAVDKPQGGEVKAADEAEAEADAIPTLADFVVQRQRRSKYAPQPQPVTVMDILEYKLTHGGTGRLVLEDLHKLLAERKREFHLKSKTGRTLYYAVADAQKRLKPCKEPLAFMKAVHRVTCADELAGLGVPRAVLALAMAMRTGNGMAAYTMLRVDNPRKAASAAKKQRRFA